MKTSPKGFTLIELLVVIAIIALLASIILAALNSARVKARDSKRIADMRDFETALELYYSDHNHYPYTYCSGSSNWTSFDSPFYSPKLVCDTSGGSGQTLTQIMAPYIGQLSDPKSLGDDSGYLYINNVGNNGDPNGYCILFWRTPENLNDFPKSFWYNTARCTAINGAGQCSSGGNNEIWHGVGAYANGC